MTKKEIVQAIADNANLTKKDAAAALDAFVGIWADAMKADDKIQLLGFGTFKVVEKKATTVRNPRTGEKLEVPAKKVIKFKAAPSVL